MAERYAHALKLFFMRRTRLRAMRRARLLLVSQPPSHSLTRTHTPSLSLSPDTIRIFKVGLLASRSLSWR